MRWSLALLALGSLSGAAVPQGAPKDGEALIARMHARYDGKWYHTLTFVQRTTRPGRPDAVWYEASSVPGRLRIDFAPLDSANASLYSGDSSYAFRRGKLVRVDRDRNLLLTLGFDVYGQPADTTVAQLRAEGIDLGRIHSDTWEGKPVWVVGAAPGDSTSNQFWIEKDRLLFVRLIQQVPGQTGTRLLDARFNKYQPLAGGWIAVNCVINIDGKPLQSEDYTEIQANVPLDASLWDTRAYQRPVWVKSNSSRN